MKIHLLLVAMSAIIITHPFVYCASNSKQQSASPTAGSSAATPSSSAAAAAASAAAHTADSAGLQVSTAAGSKPSAAKESAAAVVQNNSSPTFGISFECDDDTRKVLCENMRMGHYPLILVSRVENEGQLEEAQHLAAFGNLSKLLMEACSSKNTILYVAGPLKTKTSSMVLSTGDMLCIDGLKAEIKPETLYTFSLKNSEDLPDCIKIIQSKLPSVRTETHSS